MAEKKHSVLALLEILKKYSDEEHVLTLKEIQAHLENEYDTVLDRRTIYTNLDILEQFGYEISDFEDNGKGYSWRKENSTRERSCFWRMPCMRRISFRRISPIL